MNTIDHLNRILEASSLFGRNLTPLEALVRFRQIAPTLSREERENYRLMAGASTMGKVRVAYSVPFKLYCELRKSTFDLREIDCSSIELPHDRIFFEALDDKTRTGYFYFFTIDHLIDKKRVGIFYGSGSVILDLRDGMSISEAIRTAQRIEYPLLGQGSLSPQEKLQEAVDILIKVSLFLTSTNDYSDLIIPSIHGSKKNRNKPEFFKHDGVLREIGGKFMSALRRYEAQQEAEAASRPHGSPRPHLRAGHFHLHWVGKRENPTPKVMFHHPCLVNADSIGSDVEIQRTVVA